MSFITLISRTSGIPPTPPPPPPALVALSFIFGSLTCPFIPQWLHQQKRYPWQSVTLILPFPPFFSFLVRQVHVSVRTNTPSQCTRLHCLSHIMHKLSGTDSDCSLCFIDNYDWSDFNTVQTFKTRTSQLVQTSEILFKCVFACMV